MVMLRVERDQDLHIAGADGSARAIRLVDPGVRQADVVEDGLQFIPRNLLSQNRFDLITEARCLLHPQAGARPHMQAQQSRIYLGKEVLSQKRKQPERQQAERQKADYETSSMLKSGFEQLFIAAAEVFEFTLEAALKPAQERLGRLRPVLVSAHDVHNQRGNECA